MSEIHRLSKLMSQRGICSRREADKLIEQGLVRVDGEVVNTLGVKFPDDVKIKLSARAKEMQDARVTIMINKPIGVVSGQAEDDYVPAVRLIKHESQSDQDQTGMTIDSKHFNGLAPAGRLDIDSQGLLILTQDGRIAKLLIGHDSGLEKEYLVRIRGEVSDSQLEQLCFGLELDGKPLKHAKVKRLNEDQLQFILREGKKRQIRRMAEAVGLHVTGLKRVRVGELRLGKLAEGEWRYVRSEEFAHRKPARGEQQGSFSRSSEISQSGGNPRDPEIHGSTFSSSKPDLKASDLKPSGAKKKSLYGQGKRRPKPSRP